MPNFETCARTEKHTGKGVETEEKEAEKEDVKTERDRKMNKCMNG
jgi:hypothetical protein